mgnify:FL=1
MKQILLGTEGNQPFKITQQGVSRQHARITIGDDGVWTLEDLNSTNGTFIRNEEGEMRRVGALVINPMTFICLGPNNANGCSFYATHLINPDDFIKEFQYLNQLEDNFDAQEEHADKTARTIRMLIAIVSFIALVGSFVVSHGPLQVGLLRVGTAVSLLSTIFFNPNEKKKKLQEEREKFHTCPNPKCSHIMKSREIRMMQCTKCKCR